MSQLPDSYKYRDRIIELEKDGYLVRPTMMRPWWILSEKGWTVLVACADRPIKKPPQRIMIGGK